MLTALLLSAALVAAHQDEEVMIDTTWTSQYRCNEGNAVRLSVARLAAEPQRWQGRCVALHGWWRGRAFYGSRRLANARGSWTQREPGSHVGIYGRRELLDAAPDYPVRAMVIGMAGSCEELRDRGAFVRGYCHTANGPYLAVASMDGGR